MGTKPFLEISWNDEDLKKALRNSGYKPTTENVEKIKQAGVRKLLEDNSIEEGWDTIFWMVEQQAKTLDK